MYTERNVQSALRFCHGRVIVLERQTVIVFNLTIENQIKGKEKKAQRKVA